MSTSSSTSSSFLCPATSSSTPATPGSGRAASTPAVVADAPPGLAPLSPVQQSQIRFLNSIVMEYLSVLGLSDLAKTFKRRVARASDGALAKFPVVFRVLDVFTVVDIDDSTSTVALPAPSPAGSFPSVLSKDTEQKIKALNQVVFEYLNELRLSDMATQFKYFIKAMPLAKLSMLHVVRIWLSALTGITLEGADCELGPPTIVTRFTQVDYNAVERRAMEAISMLIGQPVISSPPSVPTALGSNQILYSTKPDYTLPSNLDLRFPSGSPHQTLPSSSTTNDTSMNNAIATSILSHDTAPPCTHDPFTSHDTTPANYPLDWDFDIPTSSLPQTLPYSSTITNDSLLDHARATSILSLNTAPLSSHDPFTSHDPTPADFPLISGSDMEFNIPTSNAHQTLPSSSTTNYDTSLDHAIATSILSLDAAPHSSHDLLTSHDPTPADYLLPFSSHREFDVPCSPHQMYPSSSTLDTWDYTIDTPIFRPDTVPPSFHDPSTSHDPSHDPSTSHPPPFHDENTYR